MPNVCISFQQKEKESLDNFFISCTAIINKLPWDQEFKTSIFAELSQAYTLFKSAKKSDPIIMSIYSKEHPLNSQFMEDKSLNALFLHKQVNDSAPRSNSI